MKLNRLLMVMTLAALLIAPAGCIFSPDDDPTIDPVVTELPPAKTKEILMSNFKKVYEDMNIEGFINLLDENYKTILLAETQDQWGWADDFYFNYTDEVSIHRKMFRGDPGVDPNGNTVHPIASIEVDLLEQMVGWLDIPNDDIDFGGYEGQYAPFRVTIQFHDADLTHRFLVQQQVNFYVIPVEQDGQTIWKMLGQRGVAVN